MRAESLNYSDQVGELSRRTATSLVKTRKFIKTYRRLLKGSLKRGVPIDIEGLARIYPSTKKENFIIFDDNYGFKEQVRDLVKVLGYGVGDVRGMLKSYIQLLLIRVSMGYEIRISGVFLMRPDYIDENRIGFVIRLSPTLEKPEKVTLKVLHLYGEDQMIELPKDKIVYKLEVDDSLETPECVRTENALSDIEYINDDDLG